MKRERSVARKEVREVNHGGEVVDGSVVVEVATLLGTIVAEGVADEDLEVKAKETRARAMRTKKVPVEK